MKHTIKLSAKRARTLLGVAGIIAIGSAFAYADAGRGSIRGASRGAPAQREAPHEAPRQAPRAEEHRAPAEEHRAPVPEVRHDEHAAPQRPVEVRHDWDEHDEDARHFGGFGHGAPVYIQRGERFHALPAHYHRYHFGNIDYYIDDDTGVYYSPQPGGEYVVVQPPVGVVVPALPPGAMAVASGAGTFYYLDGVFYFPQAGGFAVVNPPPGIVVPALPTGANQVVINGNVLYQFNGFNYQPIIEGGVTMYVVNPA